MSNSHTPAHPPLDPRLGIELARAAIAQAQEHGARAALAGGLAMMTYGSDRLTADIDIVTDDPLLRPGKPGKSLTFGGRSYTKDGATIDVILRTDDKKDVYDAALGDITMRAPWKGAPKIATLTAEWLALMKFLAKRNKDIMDLQYLVRRKIVDRKLLLKHCQAIYGKHAYLIIDELQQEFTLADAGFGA
jgi:hypothetical protein